MPALDPRPLLTMGDMMGDMEHGAHAAAWRMARWHGRRTWRMRCTACSARRRRCARRTHAAEYGPGVDMRVDTPRTNLDDPGVGLRDNGRRVLTYADLHTIGRADRSAATRSARSSCT